jgi:TolB-like protein/AraC-like DNA-binding protein/Tfp pilus assembly protein PilF
MEDDFLNRITEIITENISNERFGVSELARETGMSRSNLLRKVKKLTKLSVSQFIRQVRLKNALEMLRQTSLNVSEISYKVGFSSTSYFIKCFRDFYGYPPGEVGKRDVIENESNQISQSRKKRMIIFLGATSLIVLLSIVLFIYIKPFSFKHNDLEKSIAVLPFINDSNDSTNVYIINGLMESLLNNLQRIEDLRVISRTSVEKYRNTSKTIPEIASELNVNYIVEGSGQKIGDEILLNIQMIEAPDDKHLWGEQYDREAKDIFKLQKEVARNIVDEIRAIITPEEEERINIAPTDDLVAYDYFLKGLDLLFKENRESIEEAITYFRKAIEHDNEFARAYADIAIAYYFLDIFQVEKKYSDQINYYADKALLFDSKLPQSLIAKAVFYMNNAAYEMAVPYLEKALEYNPNSALVINILSDFYANYIPDTEKYLEYALKGIRLDIAAHDSVTASIIYLHLSNAFIQSGFLNEAEKYIIKSLEYNPENLFSELVKAYVLFAKDRDLLRTKELLIEALYKDSTRLDLMQEIGKICYYMRDYAGAYNYYKKFIEIKEAQNLDIFRYENDKIGIVLSKMGQTEESEKYLNDFQDYAENDNSIYKHLNLAMFYSYRGDTKKAIEHMKIFSQQSNYDYWVIIFVEMDPLIDNIKDLPEFNRILTDLEIKFWRRHKRIKASLEEKNLL